MEFAEFLNVAAYGFKTGAIKCSCALSVYDMAVTFAIDRLYQRKGKGCVIMDDEIYQEMLKFTIPETLPTEGWFYEAIG